MYHNESIKRRRGEEERGRRREEECYYFMLDAWERRKEVSLEGSGDQRIHHSPTQIHTRNVSESVCVCVCTCTCNNKECIVLA